MELMEKKKTKNKNREKNKRKKKKEENEETEKKRWKLMSKCAYLWKLCLWQCDMLKCQLLQLRKLLLKPSTLYISQPYISKLIKKQIIKHKYTGIISKLENRKKIYSRPFAFRARAATSKLPLLAEAGTKTQSVIIINNIFLFITILMK